MHAERTHSYEVSIKWTGNNGSGTSSYSAYSRNHEARTPTSAEPILMASDPAFRGDAARYNPEQLLVASLSSCHMLWFLHLCSTEGLAIAGYEDAAAGTMRENPDGSGEFTSVTLRPLVTIAQAIPAEQIEAIHHRAHELCFIARSVNFSVYVEPRTQVVKTL